MTAFLKAAVFVQPAFINSTHMIRSKVSFCALSLFVYLHAATARAETLAAGVSHSVVVKPDGTVWSWGANGSGQLGDGTTTGKTTPTNIPTLTSIVAVAAGSAHSLALRNDGTVWAWGSNGFGQIGDASVGGTRTSPVLLGLTDIVAIAAGEYHSVALDENGTVWTWGRI